MKTDISRFFSSSFVKRVYFCTLIIYNVMFMFAKGDTGVKMFYMYVGFIVVIYALVVGFLTAKDAR